MEPSEGIIQHRSPQKQTAALNPGFPAGFLLLLVTRGHTWSHLQAQQLLQLQERAEALQHEAAAAAAASEAQQLQLRRQVGHTYGRYAGVFRVTPVCFGSRRCVLDLDGMFRVTPVCFGSHWCVFWISSVCFGSRRYVSGHAGVFWIMLVYLGSCWCVLHCYQVWQ